MSSKKRSGLLADIHIMQNYHQGCVTFIVGTIYGLGSVQHRASLPF